MIGHRRLLLVGLCLAAQAVAAQAAAELVYFSSGRTLSVKGHRDEGAAIVLVLRGGGEVSCDATLVERIGPDEVAYPEPADPLSFVSPGEGLPVRFSEIIDRASTEHGVDPQLVRAVIEVESAYRPEARSRKGAMGLMQLMPETARLYAVADPFDPEANIAAGTRHLRSLLDRFELSLALAAYNAGVAAVERFGGVPPYAETQAYVKRVLALLQGPRTH